MDRRGGWAVLAQKHIMTQTFFCIVFDNKFLRGCLHEKTGTGASFIPGWLFDFVSLLHYDWALSLLFEGTLHVGRIHVWFKSQTLLMGYPFQSKSGPVSHQNGSWSFWVYMIPLQDFLLEWNSRPGTRTGVNSRQGDSCRHDILWWSPGWKSPRCYVNTPLRVHCM